jgi:hypothetical protein
LALVNLTAAGESLLTAIRDRLPTALTDDGGLHVSDPNTTAAGTLTAAGQAVEVPCSQGVSGFSASVTGTFVGTVHLEGNWPLPDGSPNWIPTAGRQTVTGRYGNSVSQTHLVAGRTGAIPSALMRGVAQGATAYRVVCTAYTSGSIGVRLTVNAHPAATFTNVVTDVRSPAQYAAALAGGRTLFQSSLGDVSAGAALAGITGNVVAVLRNPANSPSDLTLDRYLLSVSANAVFRRYRVTATTPGTSATIPGIAGTPQPVINRGGGTNTANGAFFGSGLGSGVVGITGGTAVLAELFHSGGNTRVPLEEEETLILRPGQDHIWTVSAGNATVGAVWHETPASI